MAAASNLVHGFKPLACPPICHPLDYKMLELSQPMVTQSLEHAINFHKSSSTPCLSYSPKQEDNFPTNPRIEIIAGQGLPQVQALVVEVAIAMAAGVSLEPAPNGLGGAYFILARNSDTNQTIAVAKPVDEEPLALNNPKGFGGRLLGQPGMKSSIRIGETGARESAAYLLDHGGFSGVPPTALVKFSHFNFNSDSDSNPSYKIASLQRFVKHDSDAGDLGPSSFSVTSVHHIGILDIRLMNLDRHAGNLLVKQDKKQSFGQRKADLVPIDHGFCLPECLDNPYFEWQHWPQASLPFSEEEVDYISGLDPFKDAEMLRDEVPSIRESSIRVLVLCTIFLKQATGNGLCLVDIGEMMTREFLGGKEHLSSLESLCATAKASLGEYDHNAHCDHDEEDDEILVPCVIYKNKHIRGGLVRSLSSPAPYNLSNESIFWGDMDEEEWESFLDNFQKLLPKAFEERASSKQRLRTSCAF